MIYKANSLSGTNMCATKRKHNFEVKKEYSVDTRRSVICRQAILDFKHKPQKHKTIDDVVKAIEDGVNLLEGVNVLAKPEQIKEACTLATKYLNADDRLCVEPRTKIVKAFGEEFSVTPAFCYEDTVTREVNGVDTELPLVEVVHLTTRKQEASLSSGKNCLKSALEPMCYLLYGKECLGGKDGIVKVTYDALKTSADKNGDYSSPWKQTFEGDTKSNATYNRISLMFYVLDGEIFLKSGKGKFEEVMPKFEKTWNEFLTGVEKCPKATCETCELFDLCYYNRPPVKKDEKVVKRDLKDIQYSDAQMRIINYKKGYARANCGAGSGKTQVVVMRIFNLLKSGVSPEDILMTTFTNVGVDEMRLRLKECCETFELDIDVSKVKISTFNGLGGDVISHYYKELGFTEPPTLIDDVDKMDIVTQIISSPDIPRIEGFDYKNPYLKQRSGYGGAVIRLCNEIAFIRNNNFSKEDYLRESSLDTVKAEQIWSIYETFCKVLMERNLIDFSDQSTMVEKMLMLDEYSLTNLFKFKHIIVDEFQDSNSFQLMFIKELISTFKFESLMVVGDDNQSIYLFRGSSTDNIINLPEKLDVEIDDFYLNENYRSTKQIVELANELISKNTKRIVKNMTSSREGDMPLFKAFATEKAEQEWIVTEIEKLVKSGVSPEDIAFLSFKKSTANTIGRELAKRGILAMPSFSEAYIETSRVKAVIELAEFFRNPENTKCLMVYLNELYNNTFFDKSVEEVNEIVEKNKADFLDVYLGLTLEEKKDYFMKFVYALDDKTDDIFTKFLDVLKTKERYSVLEIINYIINMKRFKAEDGAKRDGNYGAVALSTAHSSKGREWKYVFSTFTDFDNAGYSMSLEEIEERRRLIFVAVTRAKDNLICTCCDTVKSDTELTEKPNRWWSELRQLNGFKVDATGIDKSFNKVS